MRAPAAPQARRPHRLHHHAVASGAASFVHKIIADGPNMFIALGSLSLQFGEGSCCTLLCSCVRAQPCAQSSMHGLSKFLFGLGKVIWSFDIST